MSGSGESESSKRTESDGWHLVWILEEGDSVFARVKVDSESLMATAITVNLYVDTICGLFLIGSNSGKRKRCPWFMLLGTQSLNGTLD